MDDYDIGGWFYEPKTQKLYTIIHNNCDIRLMDNDGIEILSFKWLIKERLEDKSIFYIPHTDNIDKLKKEVLAIELRK